MINGDSTGKSFLVTGANSGIGRTTAEALAERGGRVILASRSEHRTLPVLDEIRKRTGGADVEFMRLDVADLLSVRQAAAQVLASGKPLDVLINNAGVAATNGLSPQGFDLTYATNHIGPFLLTELLLPRLRESPQGRIVNVSSGAHAMVKQFDWSRLEVQSAPTTAGLKDYGATKLMNILHAAELARRLAGTGVTTYALHPGAVATNVWRALPQPIQWFIKLFMLTSDQGARTTLYCATAPELAAVSGRYYEKSRERTPSRAARDPELAKELWQRTEAAIAAVS